MKQPMSPTLAAIGRETTLPVPGDPRPRHSRAERREWLCIATEGIG
jgi:hypothetical protein